nr:OmpA family protein [Paracoccus saliphilus]
MAKIKALPLQPAPLPDDDEDEHDCPACPPVGAPAWMATFADMATLLMAFFVLILSFANFDEVSFKKMTGALREHFGVRMVDIFPNPEATTIIEMTSPPATPPSNEDVPEPQDGAAQNPPQPPADEAMEKLTEALEQAMTDGEVTVSGAGGTVTMRLPEGAGAQDLAQAMAAAARDIADAQQTGSGGGAAEGPTGGTGGDQPATGEAGSSSEQKAAIAEARLKVALQEIEGQGLVDVQQKNDKVIVTVGAGGAFQSGSANLTDEAREIMSRIALASAGDAGQIIVTGHTDSVPLTGGPFVDNWGLAAARASAVVREMGSQVDPARLSAISKGDAEPVADNGSEEGRSANRRIEIVFDFAP